MSERRFRAGCGRERGGPADLDEMAYTELAFPECPDCPHRVVPEGGPAFCRWLATDRPRPFADLARLASPDALGPDAPGQEEPS